MQRSISDVFSVAATVAVVATLVALGTGFGAGCFTSSELSCQSDDDCFPSQTCNTDRNICESAPGGGNGSGNGTGDCMPTVGEEDEEQTCYDGKDNDCDGNTDCGDPDCRGDQCGVGEGGGGARCEANSDGDVVCVENNCCNCVDDDGDGIRDFGAKGKQNNGIVERECREENCEDGASPKELCACVYDPGEEKNDYIDQDESHSAGICMNQYRNSDGACVRPPDFESTESMKTDENDNDCDGLTDEQSNKTPGNRCTGSEECLGPCEDRTCAHRIFVTSPTNVGDLDGLSGADQLCSDSSVDSDATWKAILSTSEDDAKDRIELNGPVALPDGTVVVEKGEDLWNVEKDLASPVSVNASGNDVTSTPEWVWTGTDPTGEVAPNHCMGWDSDGSEDNGTAGKYSVRTRGWISQGERNCSEMARLYCIDGQ